MGGLVLIGIIWIIIDVIKSACEPTITSENWNNLEQWDVFNLSSKDLQKKLRGKK